MNYYQKFDDDFRGLFLAELRENEDFGTQLWSALANVSWYHESDSENTECGYSHTGAAASIIGYMLCKHVVRMDFFLNDSASAGTVSEHIANAMASKGWRFKVQ
ncbi:MAG: hypothetical protein LBI13_11010 [Streptococcaceae bacterium]|jgi:hypothetical protein|nr:hypothetical protein [Streptococcaceae bacterium]